MKRNQQLPSSSSNRRDSTASSASDSSQGSGSSSRGSTASRSAASTPNTTPPSSPHSSRASSVSSLSDTEAAVIQTATRVTVPQRGRPQQNAVASSSTRIMTAQRVTMTPARAQLQNVGPATSGQSSRAASPMRSSSPEANPADIKGKGKERERTPSPSGSGSKGKGKGKERDPGGPSV